MLSVCEPLVVKLYDERYVLLVRQIHLFPLPEAVVYRKGIYGHSQMLRVHLRKTFSAGIVSVKKGKQTQLLVAKRNRRYQFSFLFFFISKYLLRIQGPRINNIYLKLISRERYHTKYRFNFEFIISDLILSNSIFHYYIKTNIMI